MNRYAYTGDNPINYADLTGLAPGDSFGTPEAAAINALQYANPKSTCSNKEFGGSVYQEWSIFGPPSYTYDEPVQGGVDSVEIRLPMFHTVVAVFHTHGAYDPRYDSENFSRPDKIDVRDLKVPGYLATPAGAIKRILPDPKRGVSAPVTVGATSTCGCGR